MMFFAGMFVGILVSSVIFVAFMGHKHWEWYNELADTKIARDRAAEERDHYKNMATPNQWGTVAQREAGIVERKRPDYPDYDGGEVKFKFDDIREGGD